MNGKEQQRAKVLNQMERGGLTGEEAAGLMGLSVRQVRRLLAAYRQEGVAALSHGNRGRAPVHRIPEHLREQAVALARGLYQGLNHHHLQEVLAEREELTLSRSSLWRILTEAKVPSPKRRRRAQHRHRRERYPQEGMLLQVDGSRHDWLEGRGPYLTLVGAIDDATGTVPHALFREQEDAQGYLLLLREIIGSKGIPLALYSDRHSIFQVNPKQGETLEEQLAGERQPTQVGRAMNELGIQSIVALSPQAKGRVERLWGTFQDRLVSELRLAGAATLEEANQVLWDFLPRFDARFAVPPSQPGTAYRRLEPGISLEGVLCFKYQRTVAKDNTVRLGEHTLQILAGTGRSSYARARVEVQERQDGSVAVTYQGRVIASREAPPLPSALRARKGAWREEARADVAPNSALVPGRDGTPESGAVVSGQEHQPHPRKPSPNHPWRRSLVVTKSQNY
ncbi:MAG: ISNCY family transposase [Chloroflexi bacterium]|nr:ISNCY family transposase [Chloroflexota bacterium]